MPLPLQQERNHYHEIAKIDLLQELTCQKLPELFEKLEIILHRVGKTYVGECPIHLSDNPASLNLYHTGDFTSGNWKCYTRGCERFFKKTIIGFVRGVLSQKQYGWQRVGDRCVTFYQAVDWLCTFLSQPLASLEIDPVEQQRKKFIANTAFLSKRPDTEITGVTRAKVLENLTFPANFFVKRGFSTSILETFCVGYYKHAERRLSGRVVVPIFDDTGKIAMGFMGRSIFEQCPTCKRYHAAGVCPKTATECFMACKWMNQPQNFCAHSFLYGFHRAKQAIRDSGVAVIVEGSPDVWRLAEAGITNAVSLGGTYLSDEQRVLLERSGAMRIVLMLDNDQAGRAATAEISGALKRSYRLFIPQYPAKDVGDMSVAQIKELNLSQY